MNIVMKTPARSSLQELCMTALFSAIICVLAVITIPIGPIPFTLSLFAIFLTGGILKPKNALCATLCYLLIGVIGVPVYSGFKAGIGVLFGVTGGYLMAYPLMAWVTAMSVKIFRRRNVVSLSVGMVVALIICYSIGTAWFIFLTKSTLVSALSLCVLPFIWFDLLKIVLAVFLSLVLAKTPIRVYIS